MMMKMTNRQQLVLLLLLLQLLLAGIAEVCRASEAVAVAADQLRHQL
jgi:hypothetical protein